MSIFNISFIIEKSIIIDNTVENIWEHIIDKKKKILWSPRNILEKDAKQKFS
jgi:hypothetical protein